MNVLFSLGFVEIISLPQISILIWQVLTTKPKQLALMNIYENTEHGNISLIRDDIYSIVHTVNKILG